VLVLGHFYLYISLKSFFLIRTAHDYKVLVFHEHFALAQNVKDTIPLLLVALESQDLLFVETA